MQKIGPADYWHDTLHLLHACAAHTPGNPSPTNTVSTHTECPRIHVTDEYTHTHTHVLKRLTTHTWDALPSIGPLKLLVPRACSTRHPGNHKRRHCTHASCTAAAAAPGLATVDT